MKRAAKILTERFEGALASAFWIDRHQIHRGAIKGQAGAQSLACEMERLSV